MAQFWFQIFSLFSGRSLMDDWYATGFNSFFTVVPINQRRKNYLIYFRIYIKNLENLNLLI